MPTALELLPAHLDKRYGIQVARLTPLEPWAPEGVQRVDRTDGPSWVARVFGPSRPLKVVEGDAEILRFLEQHDYPAERLADDESVSTFEKNKVLVTQYVPGKNLRGPTSATVLRKIGDLLGRLHALPEDTGAVAREGGSWHGTAPKGGGRRADVEALLPQMDTFADGLPKDQLDDYKALRAVLEGIDECLDLPKALIHVDFGGVNIVKTKDGGDLVVVDWTGAGRGPRVLSMVCLTSGAQDLRLVDAAVAGYSKHVRLTDEELDRLPAAMCVHSLVLWCAAGFLRGRSTARQVLDRHTEMQETTKRIAARAREAFGAAKPKPPAARGQARQ